MDSIYTRFKVEQSELFEYSMMSYPFSEGFYGLVLHRIYVIFSSQILVLISRLLGEHPVPDASRLCILD